MNLNPTSNIHPQPEAGDHEPLPGAAARAEVVDVLAGALYLLLLEERISRRTTAALHAGRA